MIINDKDQELSHYKHSAPSPTETKTEKTKMISDIQTLIKQYRKTSMK